MFWLLNNLSIEFQNEIISIFLNKNERHGGEEEDRKA